MLPIPAYLTHATIEWLLLGTAYNGATKDTNDLSFARSDNHVIPNKNEICKMDGGMANKFVSNVEKPNSLFINVKYVPMVDFPIYAISPIAKIGQRL